jgi:hypothetical protein
VGAFGSRGTRLTDWLRFPVVLQPPEIRNAPGCGLAVLFFGRFPAISRLIEIRQKKQRGVPQAPLTARAVGFLRYWGILPAYRLTNSGPRGDLTRSSRPLSVQSVEPFMAAARGSLEMQSLLHGIGVARFAGQPSAGAQLKLGATIVPPNHKLLRPQGPLT